MWKPSQQKSQEAGKIVEYALFIFPLMLNNEWQSTVKYENFD